MFDNSASIAVSYSVMKSQKEYKKDAMIRNEERWICRIHYVAYAFDVNTIISINNKQAYVSYSHRQPKFILYSFILS